MGAGLGKDYNGMIYRKARVKGFWVLLCCVLFLGACGRGSDVKTSGEQGDGASVVVPTIVPTAEPTPTAIPIPTPEPTPVPTPEPTPVQEITVSMVGDILQHTPLAESGKKEDGTYDFSAVFANMSEEIAAADLALVNQEVIIGGVELGISGYPTFNAPYELGDALVEAGFDVVLHATNHALDKRAKGLLNCINYWETNHPGTAVLGIHESVEDAQEIYVYEQDGIKLAILNYTYGTNGIPLPQDMPYAVDMLDKDKIAEDLQKAKELADFVIVCPHWGSEYVLKQTKEQENWATFFAENGADLILGTHPHVIEPVEWIFATETQDGAEKDSADKGTLVYYSLGNFANWTSGSGAGIANRMVGGMAQVTISVDENGEVYIADYGVTPVVCHLERGFGGVTVYPLAEYTEELAARNEIVKQDANFSLDYCLKLAEDVFGELWTLPQNQADIAVK